MNNFFFIAFNFVKKNFFRNPLFTFWYIVRYCQKDFIVGARFYTEEEFLKHVDEGKSLIRLGDGETYLINRGHGVFHQPYNEKLRKYLLTIIHEYNDDSPYLLGLAEGYINKRNKDLKVLNLLRCWLPSKILYKTDFNHDATYFNAHYFYKSGSFKKLLEKILEKNKVLIVANPENIKKVMLASVKNETSLSFIEAPSTDAFSHYEELHKKILSKIGAEKYSWRVVLSVGPTSKALAYDLCKEGVISYDIGMGIEASTNNRLVEYLR